MRFSQYGENEFTNVRLVREIQVVEYDHADLDVSAYTLKIPVQAGTIVLGVGHEVVEAFAGGTPDVLVGDGDDPDGYIKTGDIVFGTVGDFKWSAADAAFVLGKKYSTAGYILVTATASLTAGKGRVFIESINTTGNWRVADL